MSIVNIAPTDSFDTWRTKTNTIATDLGDTSTLTTVATNVVGAANEISNDIGTLSALLVNGADLVSAINEARRLAFVLSIGLG